MTRYHLLSLVVAPFAGAWIEISDRSHLRTPSAVAPFAGAWIEISNFWDYSIFLSSLPSRERGLK